MSLIVVIKPLMSVLKLNFKWLPVCKTLCILCSADFHEVSFCIYYLLLIKCHTTRHNICYIICIFYTEYYERLIILGSCICHSNITNLLIFRVGINKVPSNYFWSVMPLLDHISHINTFGFDLCYTFGNTKYNVQNHSLT